MEFMQVQACNIQQCSRIMINLHLMVPLIGEKKQLAILFYRNELFCKLIWLYSRVICYAKYGHQKGCPKTFHNAKAVVPTIMRGKSCSLRPMYIC